jgi:hypothetical protein
LVTRAILAMGRGEKSADSTRSTSLAVALTKLELVERAAAWGVSRGVEFDLGRLNEWIDNALVDEGDRGENVGKRPVYRYGCRHYRRVLQVLRLYSRGIKSTDRILIMLFLNRHGVKAHEVREPLVREFARGVAKINAQARSVRFDQEGSIPPKHEESLIRSLGQADDRFVAAKIVLSGTQMIEVMRAARNPDPERAQRNPKFASGETAPVVTLQFLLGGLMAAGDDNVREAERLLRSTSNSELEAALSTLLSIRSVFASGKIASSKLILGPFRDAYLASFAQPEFVTVQLVNMLRLSASSAQLPVEELLKFYGFTME